MKIMITLLVTIALIISCYSAYLSYLNYKKMDDFEKSSMEDPRLSQRCMIGLDSQPSIVSDGSQTFIGDEKITKLDTGNNNKPGSVTKEKDTCKTWPTGNVSCW